MARLRQSSNVNKLEILRYYSKHSIIIVCMTIHMRYHDLDLTPSDNAVQNVILWLLGYASLEFEDTPFADKYSKQQDATVIGKMYHYDLDIHYLEINMA